jgi:hypothetical protein
MYAIALYDPAKAAQVKDDVCVVVLGSLFQSLLSTRKEVHS